MIVFGGRSDETGPHHSNRETYDDSVYMYDSIEQVWIRPEVNGVIPCGRRSHCACESIHTHIYVVAVKQQFKPLQSTETNSKFFTCTSLSYE